MTLHTKEEFLRAADELYAAYKWKGAFWETMRVERYIRALRKAALNPRRAPKWIIAYLMERKP